MREIAVFENSAAFSSEEKLALRLAVALTRTPADISDAFFTELRAQFSEPQLVELSAAITWENSRARFNRVFDIQPGGFSKGAFCVMPERP